MLLVLCVEIKTLIISYLLKTTHPTERWAVFRYRLCISHFAFIYGRITGGAVGSKRRVPAFL